ncbi:MAG TPA: delta-60 repeat domain-containing protein, partial [Actinomycetota bacterium]|nr:delta-60 repeat domain-containing protein [Actinomycetota bacterium]
MVRTSIRPGLVLGMAATLTLATAPVAVAAPGRPRHVVRSRRKGRHRCDERGDGLNAVAIASTGRIVVAGTSKDGARFAIARYRTDGSLDPTFGDHGIAQTNVTDANDILQGVAVQPDGDIVVVGQVGSGPRFVVARYTAGGRLDPTFGGDGMVSTSFEARGGGAAVAVAVLAGGKILAAGVA